MKKDNGSKLLCLICFILLVCFYVPGCTTSQAASSGQSQASLSGATGSAAETNAPVYHDFDDIPVPKELTIVKDRTVVVSSPGFISGNLALKGRVDPDSLFKFFSVYMEKDNWEVFSIIKAPEATIMVFQKAMRCAVITIREEQIFTYVEIGVAPTLKGASKNSSSDLSY